MVDKQYIVGNLGDQKDSPADFGKRLPQSANFGKLGSIVWRNG